ncbi:VTT domain-containing protein [Azospirillum sp.]|uniref:DedA family protein n=1 Tax=Azospirillum sp. TaxID=34012 RepID=UPI003D720A5A
MAADLLSLIHRIPFALPLALAALTFLHEDVAIATAAGLIGVGTMTFAAATLILLAGIVSGDCVIYALGLLSRRVVWLRRATERSAFARLHAALERNLLATIITARLMPGILFPMYFACGAIRIPFIRFLLMTLATAVFHVCLLLTLLNSSAAVSAQSVRVGGVAVAALLIALRTRFGQALAGKAAARVGIPLKDALSGWLAGPRATGAVRLPGMPPISAGYRPIGLAERIPPLLFYVPLAVQWLALGLRHRSVTLPTAANPSIEAGGLLGESKHRCIELIGPGGRPWVAASTAIVNTVPWPAGAAEALVAEAGLTFPLVAKPDIGWRGFGVRLVRGAAELQAYLAAMPRGCRVILQAYVPHAGEAGIFYVRHPGRARGAIVSLTLRYFPHVVGDGASTLDQLIERDPRAAWKGRLHRAALGRRLTEVPAQGEVVRLALVGSSRVGGLYKDGRSLITPALCRRFDTIADAMPGFHFGRFDVRFASAEALAAGEDFRIIEVNGAGAEMIHVWDPDKRLMEVYADLFRQQALMFEIAAANRDRGVRPLSLRGLIGYQQRQQRLLRAYPPSN